MTSYKLHCGDSAELLKQYPDNHFDSIVTDPPYLIGFLGKDWDKEDNCLRKVFAECLRVLKPGGHMVSFSASRTYHRIAVMIEESGFEIKDQLMWCFGSGFPKSQDIGKQIQKKLGVKETRELDQSELTHAGFHDDKSDKPNPTTIIPTDPEAKQWEGWKTALKPAMEPIVLARKPTKLTYADNVLTHGTGGLNIDACRLSNAESYAENPIKQSDPNRTWSEHTDGRYPSNVLGEIEGHRQYFYNPKVSRAERHIGMTELPKPRYTDDKGIAAPPDQREVIGNNHPTVKPVELMRWLVKLITPKGGIVLDPFNGSGSTGMAAMAEGCSYVGCDLDENYINIATKRIDAYISNGYQFSAPAQPKTNFDEIFGK